MCTVQVRYTTGLEEHFHDLTTVRITDGQLIMFRKGSIVEEIKLDELDDLQIEKDVA